MYFVKYYYLIGVIVKMKKKVIDNFMKYGIDKDLSMKLNDLNLTVSKCKILSKNDLLTKYNLNNKEISIIKLSVVRQPIEESIVDTLLSNSNYTCNICKGTKSHSFIIHHIEEYEKSQDNTYNNLIVLCPADHDLAHKIGVSLTNTITKKQLIDSKIEWEKQVKENNLKKASEKINISEEVVDFVNIQRLEELVFLIFKKIPNTYALTFLQNKKILNSDGFFDEYYVRNNLSNSKMLFSYISSGEGIHYLELLKEVAKKKNFINLRSIFKIRAINKNQINGQYVFFTGGFYSRSVKLPLTNDSQQIYFHYKKQKIRIECYIDSQYALSISALGRLGKKTLYSIYGVVKNTYKIGEIWVISISPYMIGFPEKRNSDDTFNNSNKNLLFDCIEDEEDDEMFFMNED